MKRAGVITICAAMVAVFAMGDQAEAGRRCGGRIRHRSHSHHQCCAPAPTCCDSYNTCDSGCDSYSGGCDSCGGGAYPAGGGVHVDPGPGGPTPVPVNPNQLTPAAPAEGPNPNQSEIRGTN